MLIAHCRWNIHRGWVGGGEQGHETPTVLVSCESGTARKVMAQQGSISSFLTRGGWENEQNRAG